MRDYLQEVKEKIGDERICYAKFKSNRYELEANIILSDAFDKHQDEFHEVATFRNIKKYTTDRLKDLAEDLFQK